MVTLAIITIPPSSLLSSTNFDFFFKVPSISAGASGRGTRGYLNRDLMFMVRFCTMIAIYPEKSLLDFKAMTLFFVLQIFVLCKDEKVASFIFEIGSKKLV